MGALLGEPGGGSFTGNYEYYVRYVKEDFGNGAYSIFIYLLRNLTYYLTDSLDY
jgi:hypothetical protein